MELTRRLKNLFKRTKKLVPSENPVRVYEINPDSSEISESLGITEERVEYLQKKIKHLFIEESTFTKMFEEISKETVHANELAYCCFTIGGIVGKTSIDPIIKIIEKLKDQNDGTSND